MKSLPKTPSEWAKAGDPYDCTGHLGQLFPRTEPADWLMHSFDRPAFIVWNAIAAHLHAKGWPDDKIKAWLQSRDTRWALDMSLGDALTKAATDWAEGREFRKP